MITYEKLTEITKESSEVFAGKMLHAYCDMVTLPNGKPARREYVRHIGAVAIVPMTDEGCIGDPGRQVGRSGGRPAAGSKEGTSGGNRNIGEGMDRVRGVSPGTGL